MMLFVFDSGMKPELGCPQTLPKPGIKYSRYVAHRVDLSSGQILSSARLAESATSFHGRYQNFDVSSSGSMLAMNLEEYRFPVNPRKPVVILYSTLNGEERLRIENWPEEKAKVYSTRFTPDGKQIAIVVSRDNADAQSQCSIHFHNSQTGQLVRSIEVKGSYVSNISFSQDGRVMAYSFDSREGVQTVVRDLQSNREIVKRIFKTRTYPVGAYLTPNGKSVVTAMADLCVITDVESGKDRFQTQNSYRPQQPAISADGKWLATSHMGAIGVWNLETGEPLAISAEPFDSQSNVRFLLKDTFRVIGSQITDRNLTTGIQTAKPMPIPGIHAAHYEVISSDGSLAAVMWSPDIWNPVEAPEYRFRIVDLNRGTILSTCRVPAYRVRACGFSKDNRHLYLTVKDEKTNTFPIHRFNVQSGEIDLTLAGHNDFVDAFDISPEGRYVATATAWGNAPLGDRYVRIWDTESKQLLHKIEFFSAKTESRLLNQVGNDPNPPGSNVRCHSLLFSPQGNLLVMAGFYWSDLIVIDPKTGLERNRLTFDRAQITRAAFDPSGRKLYFRERTPSASESFIKVHDFASNQNKTLFKGEVAFVNHLTVSPDGKWLGTRREENGLCYLWDLSKLENSQKPK